MQTDTNGLTENLQVAAPLKDFPFVFPSQDAGKPPM